MAAALARSRSSAKNKISFENANRLCYNCMKKVFNKRRSYSDASSIPPLNIALPGATNIHADIIKNGDEDRRKMAIEDVQVTTLSNGIKVASQESFGPFCTLGGIAEILLKRCHISTLESHLS